MSYMTVTHWEFDYHAKVDALDAYVQKAFDELKRLGAVHGWMARTGPTTATIVVLYPDEATWLSVAERVDTLRAGVAPETGASLTDAESGVVRAVM